MNEAFFKGVNVTMFAYGQTGSGKSYSVLGANTGDHRGLLPRIMQAAFDVEIRNRYNEPGYAASVSVTFLEIYNEEIKDLLDPNNSDPSYIPKKLDVKQHPTLGVFVPGITEKEVHSFDDCDKQLECGTACRTVAATSMNATSSRSHCIFTIILLQTLSTGTKLRSEMHLVDLAGSER